MEKTNGKSHGNRDSIDGVKIQGLLESLGDLVIGILPAVMWGIVKIMVPFWVPIIIRGLI